jgi:hypothetical protein
LLALILCNPSFDTEEAVNAAVDRFGDFSAMGPVLQQLLIGPIGQITKLNQNRRDIRCF